jgi:hypothetical protein
MIRVRTAVRRSTKRRMRRIAGFSNDAISSVRFYFSDTQFKTSYDIMYKKIEIDNISGCGVAEGLDTLVQWFPNCAPRRSRAPRNIQYFH